MRLATISSIIAFFVVLCVSSLALAGKYLLVEEQLAKVYKDLDPKSPIITGEKRRVSGPDL